MIGQFRNVELGPKVRRKNLDIYLFKKKNVLYFPCDILYVESMYVASLLHRAVAVRLTRDLTCTPSLPFLIFVYFSI